MLQPAVLLLQLFQPPCLIHLQPSVFRLPAVVRRPADPVLPANLAHLHPGLAFLQHPNDLFLRVSALPLPLSSLGLLYPGELTFQLVQFSGGRSITDAKGELVTALSWFTATLGESVYAY